MFSLGFPERKKKEKKGRESEVNYWKVAAISFTGLPFFNMAGIHQETLKTSQFSMDNTSPLDIFLKGQALSSCGVRSTSMAVVIPNTLSLTWSRASPQPGRH